MKKTIAAAVCAATLFTAGSANATKIGFAVDKGLGITAQFGNINAFLGDDGITGDYLFAQGKFGDKGPVNWFVGAGAFIGWNHGYGVRMPVGITFGFAKQWDVYVQVAPELDIDGNTDFGVDGALGVRFAF
jgi:hypothetical protein